MAKLNLTLSNERNTASMNAGLLVATGIERPATTRPPVCSLHGHPRVPVVSHDPDRLQVPDQRDDRRVVGSPRGTSGDMVSLFPVASVLPSWQVQDRQPLGTEPTRLREAIATATATTTKRVTPYSATKSLGRGYWVG